MEANAMNSRTFAFVSGVLVCTLFAPAISLSAGDWVDIKDPNELRALYSNKTFRGNGWVGHYRADGKGELAVNGGDPHPRTWEVRGDDQVCVILAEGKYSCNRFQRHSSNKKEMKVINVDSGKTFDFTLQEGIPKF
jgi:hypothetical protein